MALQNLLSFKGRIGRMAFVTTQVGVFMASYLAIFVLIVATGAGEERQAAMTAENQFMVAVGGLIFTLYAVWVSLAAAVKRCHDRDLSGWMLLFAFPPVLGQLWLVLCLVTGEGTRGRNRFGHRARSAASPAYGAALSFGRA